MRIRRKIFHYRLSGIFLVIGFIISFICFFNGMNLRRLIVNEEKETEKYRYKSEQGIEYFNSFGEYTTLDVLKSDEGNIILQDIWLYRNHAEATGLTEIICTQNEPLNYPVIEGKLPVSDEEVTMPTIILGIKLKEQAKETNGEYYYTIENVRYRVCAFVGSDRSNIFDYKVILYAKTMPRSIWEKINNQFGASGMIGSNKTSVNSIVAALNERASEQWEGVQIAASSYQSESIVVNSMGESVYYYIILLFCGINMILVSEYWIKERYKEIAVRKMFGYANRKIVLFLYTELIKYAFIAVAVACVIQALLTIFIDEYLLLYFSQIGYYLMIGVIFILLSCAVLMIYPLKIMKRDNVMQQILKECT